MKILLVINGTDFGGTESALAQIARNLDSRGHEVHVFSLKLPGRTGERLIESGVPLHTLGMDEVVSPWSMLKAVAGLTGWLRANHVDVVQSFLPRANIVSRLANRLSRKGRPHLSAERSTDFNRSDLVLYLNRWTSRWTDRVLAVSPSVRDVLVNRDRLPQAKIYVLENGLDLREADNCEEVDLRSELGVEKDDVLFCAVGRLIPDKGYKYLLRAIADLPSGRRPHLALVGEGPEESLLRKVISDLNLDSHVHILGFRNDVLGLLKDVDVAVLSSLEEGIPVVLLEAMACRLPIISTDVGGIRDILVDGETGILVPPAEDWTAERDQRVSESSQKVGSDALRDAMLRLIENPDLRYRMGVAGRQRLETVFSLEKIVDRLEAHLVELTSAA